MCVLFRPDRTVCVAYLTTLLPASLVLQRAGAGGKLLKDLLADLPKEVRAHALYEWPFLARVPTRSFTKACAQTGTPLTIHSALAPQLPSFELKANAAANIRNQLVTDDAFARVG